MSSPANLYTGPALDQPDHFDVVRGFAQLGSRLGQDSARQINQRALHAGFLEEAAGYGHILIQ
jgi:hypothetical protein